MPAFWKVYDAAYPSSYARAEAFKRDVVLPNLEAFINGEFSSNLLDDATIGSYFDDLRPDAGAARAVSARLSKELPADIARFQGALPDFDSSSIYAIYVMPTFYHFAGQTRDMGDKIGVFFGPDVIANVYGANANVGVIVAHELFHIYQYETYTGSRNRSRPLWLQVWIEGSAAYASEHLTPGATASDALNATLVASNAATRKQFACIVDRSWDATNGSASYRLLDVSAHPQGLPSEGGYLIGYLAAQQLSKTMSLAQIGKADNDPRFDAKLHRIISGMCG